MKKRNSLITVGIVVLIICLLSSISSALLYDRRTVKYIEPLTFKGDNINPEWSPDGSKIAYASTEGGSLTIWVVDSDGDNRRMICRPESDYEYNQPTWSPDGSKIAFVSERSGANKHYICVMDLDGSNVVKLTPCIESIFNLEWSPDGSKIMYDSVARVSGQRCIWVMDSDGSDRMRLTTIGDDRRATWSPDGSKIAYIKDILTPNCGELWIMNSDGSNKTEVIPGNNIFSPNALHTPYSYPTWNPDGSKIAFVTEYYDIAVVDLEDSSVVYLTKKRPFYDGTNIVKEKVVTGKE